METNTRIPQLNDQAVARTNAHAIGFAEAERVGGESNRDGRSGPPLGGELPAGVYLSVIAAYAWMALMAWVAFGGGREIDLELAVMTLIFIMLFGLPLIAFRTAHARLHAPWPRLDHFLSSSVDTATGRLTAAQAWVQILVIPVSLAFAATLIGAVNIIESPAVARLGLG